MMSPEERFRLVRSVGEVCEEEDELLNLLTTKPEPIFYDRFDPSETIDIFQVVLKIISVKKLIDAGCKVKIWIEDLIALLNKNMRDDLNKDLNKIQVIGNYMIEIWRAIGMNDKVEFLWSSTESNKCADKYWRTVLDVAHKNMVDKMTCDPHSKQDHLTGAAQIFCFCMQCADILFPEADICQLGMDHHKVNVFAREYCDGINRKNKLVILSHHKLPNLQNGKAKMSKSDPLSSIFTEREVDKKINNAYCPEKTVEGNPCLEYIKYIILPWFQEFKVERRVEHGGEKTFKSFEELVADYETGHLHPKDLKSVLSKALNKILQPVRDHFEKDAKAKDLLKLIKANKIPPFVEEQSVSINSQDQPASSTSSTSTSHMSLEERFPIMMSAREECLKEEELWELLTRKPGPICFDGFEPLGRMHIAQGVMKTIVVNKLTTAGCKVKIWIADWFALLNNKMGGDLKKIEVVGKYMIEVWRAIGMNHITDKVEFLWSSTEINRRANEYWLMVLDIVRRNELARIKRCVQIMGRGEKDDLTAAQIFYPVMQCAYIFFLEADICQLGMDQCKLNVLAREYCDDIKRKNKPVILSHHMIPGLLEGQEKMSKSDPLSSIFMEDEEIEVDKKINNAYCPEKTVEGNPCVEYIKYIIFPWFNEFKVERRVEHGGERTFESFEELVADYETGHLHPEDLKSALSKALNKILQPVRDHFKKDAKAKDLLKQFKILTDGVPTFSVPKMSKKLKSKVANDIPDEVIVQILHKLPIKYILRFMCVSKSWLSLIKSHNFISTHLNLSISSSNKNPLLLFRLCCPDSDKKDQNNQNLIEYYSLCYDKELYNPFMHLHYPFESLKFDIVGTVNGLVCLSYFESSHPTVIIWNPVIKKSVTLPKPMSKSYNCVSYGFGFDSKSNDYKVLRLAHQFSKTLEAEIYSYNTNSWKWVCVPSCQLGFGGRQVFLNGVMHVLAFRILGDNKTCNLILGFDVGDEIFKEIALPQSLVHHEEMSMKLLVYKESIALCEEVWISDVAYVWVMEVYGVVESWSKILRFHGNLWKWPTVFGFRKNGELFLQRHDGEIVLQDYEDTKNIVLHDYEDTKNKSLETSGKFPFVDYFVESLELLDNANASDATVSAGDATAAK